MSTLVNRWRAPRFTSTSPLPAFNALFGASTTAGPTVTETNALAVASVWRAVNLIAGTLSSLPLHAYRTDEAARVPAKGWAEDLLRSPHPDLTTMEFIQVLYTHLLLWGNAYLWVVRDNGNRVLRLVPIAPWAVEAFRVDDAGKLSPFGSKWYYIDGSQTKDGQPYWADDSEILHVPGFGYDGIAGVSPIRAARQSLGLAMAAESAGAKLFGSGMLQTGILQTEQRLTNPQIDRLQARWEAKQGGLESAHSTIVLDKGAKFTQLSIPPEDAQFIESRRFQVAEIARIFGVPPHMLMDTTNSTSWGTGIEQQTIGFVTYTLRPWLSLVEQRLSRLLRPQAVYARFSLEGLLRGDSAARAAFYVALANIGAINANEIRTFEEMAPYEGGDSYRVPLNTAPADEPTEPEETQDA